MQKFCEGYLGSLVRATPKGLEATLVAAGPYAQVYAANLPRLIVVETSRCLEPQFVAIQ